MTLRGVSYEEKRDRWRCYHRRTGNRVIQLRFDNEYDAVWKKIEICAQEGTFPFVKSVKESNTTLPVGLRIDRYSENGKPFIGAILCVVGKSTLVPFYFDDGDLDTLHRAVYDALLCRFEHCMDRLINELNQYRPLKRKLLHTLEKNAWDRCLSSYEDWKHSVSL